MNWVLDCDKAGLITGFRTFCIKVQVIRFLSSSILSLGYAGGDSAIFIAHL